MRLDRLGIATCCGASILVALVLGDIVGAHARTQTTAEDAVKTLVSRLDLEKYKATIKGLTQFGDRLQGTDRNKAAIEWIAAQLSSYGCVAQRFQYNYVPVTPAAPA